MRVFGVKGNLKNQTLITKLLSYPPWSKQCLL